MALGEAAKKSGLLGRHCKRTRKVISRIHVRMTLIRKREESEFCVNFIGGKLGVLQSFERPLTVILYFYSGCLKGQAQFGLEW